MIIYTGINIFYFNEFLFLIHGFNPHLTKEYSEASFKAFKTIYPSKIVYVIVGLILSLLIVIKSRKISIRNRDLKYFLIFGICCFMALVFIISNIFFIFLPKGPVI